jgi:outer membrane receptor protein involved in Fe transport
MASSMICGMALLGLSATQAMAAAADADAAVSEVVVTGTRIPTPNLTSISPVAVVGSEEVKLQGTTRIEDLINNLPQAFASFGGNLSNGATGSANVNLRNLGGQRTLVLIDGRRLLPGDPTQNGNDEADINFIPSSLVDRIEVLTGGASAVYGADAVAGVVNFIMQKNFEGVRIEAQTSTYQHNNNNSTIQDLVNARHALNPTQFNVPASDVRDGATNDITITIGASAPDGKGNVTAYASYRNIQPVLQANRDFSACSLSSGAKFTCGGSGTNATGNFLVFSDPSLSSVVSQLTVDRTTGNTLRPFATADQFNFAPFNFYQRPDERYSLGAFGHYQINKSIDLYAQLMFMDDRSQAQIAPSGIFGAVENFSCSNPFLSAQEANALCVAGRTTPLGPNGAATTIFSRRDVEGGDRVADLRHTDYRMVVGARGDLGDGWAYDLYGQYGTAIYQQNYRGEFSLARTALALDAVRDPATGAITCRAVLTGQDPNCVPYNPFQLGAITPQQLAYILVPGFQVGSTKEQVVSGSVTGNLGKYGIKSPWAGDGIGVALGAEYRYEASELRVDTEFSTGDLAGQGGATLPTSGSYDVYELFGEAHVPIVQDMPYIKALSFETGYRFSTYNLGFSTNTYKAGLDWTPVDDIRFRASYARAVRAPNVQELFRPSSVQLDGSTDPCSGTNPTANDPNATAANCARTGVLPGQYGKILENPAQQYNGFTGGNAHLNPEISDSYGVGAVLAPRFIPGLTLSVDYFDIKVEGIIGTIGADVTIERCLTTGNPFFCSKVHRSPGTGSLFLQTNGFIDDTTFNLGSLRTKGIDVEGNYKTNLSDWGVGDYGAVSFNFLGTYTQHLLTETLAGDTPFDCAGWFGADCGTPTPKWRHRARATWATPWKVSLSATWRYISEVKDGTSLNPVTAVNRTTDFRIPSFNYLDLAGSWAIRDNLTMRVGVNNVFDKDPPLVGAGTCPAVFCSGNTFPQVYDALGRYAFVGLTADF